MTKIEIPGGIICTKGLVGTGRGKGEEGEIGMRKQVIEPKLNHNYHLILSAEFGHWGISTFLVSVKKGNTEHVAMRNESVKKI